VSEPAQAVRRAVFLDRDGVLNESLVRNGKPYPPDTPEELRIIPGTAAALARLKERGFLLIVVTNQPDVSRGAQSRSAVEEMHLHLRSELPLDDVFTCFHDDEDGCDCRKPKPGLVTQAAEKYGIDLGASYLIGDRWRDVDAGSQAGCKTVWIDRGYQERGPANAPHARVQSLGDAVDWIEKTESNAPPPVSPTAPARMRSVRAIAACLFLALAGIYLSMSPGTVAGYGYVGEELESGLRLMSIVTAVSKERPVPEMVWSRHGLLPVLFDLPFLKIGKVFATPDFALSFQPVLFTAALLTIVFLWLRKVCSPTTSLFLALGGAFGTLLWPYAYIGLETKQSLFILLAGYLGLARGTIHGWPRVLFFAVICGLALTMKGTGVILWPVIAYLVYVQFRDDWRQRWGQLLASTLVIVAFCWGNVFLRNLYWGPGGASSIRDWLVPSTYQIFTNAIGLFGSPAKGLFVFAPILIAMVWALPKIFRSNRDLAIYAGLTLACTAAFLSILNYTSDETWGPRYLHTTIAPLLVCIGAAWPRFQWRVHAPLAVLISAGVVVSFLGSFFYYGARGQASDDSRQNTMEWLTSDNVWNEVTFSARLFQIWWRGGVDPVPWTPTHLWVWTPPADVPAWRTIDLRKYADSQSFVLYHWNRPVAPDQQTLLRFYLLCFGCGVLLLLRVGWVYLRPVPAPLSKQTFAVGLVAAATAFMAVVWVAAPQILAPKEVTPELVATPALPKIVLDPPEVVAGRGSYTLKIAALANQGVTIRYSLNGGATEEMGMSLDANGAIHFDVAAHTRKGVYRMLAFKRPQDDLWVDSDAVLVVK
jgi:D-glycero-D-manno-heptose 1,7-bisphosphate phosphatase